jgi:iron complex outermembrane receptor protein
MGRVLAVFACLCLVAPLAGAQTADERAAQAKQHYESGMASFQLEEWDKAIEEWQAGFRIKPVPQFLYNIAQAYRLSKRPEKALSFYQKYLHMDPKAPNKTEVERHIATLTRVVAEQAKSASSPPTGTIEAETGHPRPVETPPKPVEPTPAPQPAPPPTVAAPTPAPAPTATPAPATSQADLTAKAPEKPITKKGWFWGVIAGVGAVVVAGVVVGVLLGTSSGDSTKTLPSVRF